MVTCITLLVFVHLLLIISLCFVYKIFFVESKIFSKFTQSNFKINSFYISLYLFFFILLASLLFFIKSGNGIQIANFLFSFFLLFELCTKIADSEKFINWIGSDLDKSFRLLIMFVISLNCTYFFTRFTDQIIRSQGI